MSKDLTLISEVVTGLAMLPGDSLMALLSDLEPPKQLLGVDIDTWAYIRALWSSNYYVPEFDMAFEDGQYFLHSEDGLRDRFPLVVEWKGPHKPPEHNPIPADLRIDHVYIVSCKNLSKVLLNPSPSALFRSALRNEAGGVDWYYEAAPLEYLALYHAIIRHLSWPSFPASPSDLSRQEKSQLREALAVGWPKDVADYEVKSWIAKVSDESASLLNKALPSKQEREHFYWRLLRLHSSPYFMLGRQRQGPVRLRVLTPWDFRRRFKFVGLEILPDHAGQPQITWQAQFKDLSTNLDLVSRGHIEIRWSHGKFNGAPESKIYLDTPHLEAAGYEAF